MIVGLGIDLVALARVERMLARWGDRIVRRIMTDAERAAIPDGARRVEYVAGRIAAKEAASKSLGVPDGIAWHDAEVLVARPGPPRLAFHGVAAARANALGVGNALLSLTHDAGVAAAVVVLERVATPRGASGEGS
jgi:holo-[acyl-carrier protein] synthase